MLWARRAYGCAVLILRCGLDGRSVYSPLIHVAFAPKARWAALWRGRARVHAM